jgi:hypothetical protein
MFAVFVMLLLVRMATDKLGLNWSRPATLVAVAGKLNMKELMLLVELLIIL